MTSSRTTRQRASTAFVVLTAILAFVAGPIWYAGEIIRDEDRFVAVSDKVLAHPDIRRATAERATVLTLEALETDEAVADLLPGASRSLAVPLSQLAAEAMTDAAFDLLDTEVAVQARHSALRELHGQLTTESDDVIIDLRPVLTRVAREIAGPTAGSALTQFLAKSDDGRFTVAEADSGTARAVAGIRSLRSSSWIFALGTLFSLAGAVAVAHDRRRALIRAGLALSVGAASAVLIVAVVLQATPLLSDTTLGPEVGRGLAEAISTDFGEQQRSGVIGGLALAVIGLILGPRRSAAALRSFPAQAWRQDGRAIVDSVSAIVGDNPPLVRLFGWLLPALLLLGWPNPTGRVVTATIVATAAVQLALWLATSPSRFASDARYRFDVPGPLPETERAEGRLGLWRVNLGLVLLVVFLLWPAWDRRVVAGFFVVLALVQVVLNMGPARRVAQLATVSAPTARPTETTTRALRWRSVAAGVVAVLILVGIVASADFNTETAAAEVGCNGHAELCDRTIDELAWAGSHNAMSSSVLGWELAPQEGDMVAQLDHGVRALLIDTHYWDGRGTFEGQDDQAAAAAIEAALADDSPRPGLWLCHGPCALGATDLVAGLADIDVWLDENRREVVLFVVQDEISTADTFEAFEASGLAARVHQHEPGTPFPTLSELIDRDERILVYAENEGSADSWYQNAWESTFLDTPFSFAVRSDFRCDVNRGAGENPLFLINHWLTTGIPLPEAAEVVNSSAVLLERVADCETELGRRPTVIAVDFVERGDLIEVIDELNGVADGG